MRKLSYILSIKNLKSVYYAYCYSLVKYGIIYWGNNLTEGLCHAKENNNDNDGSGTNTNMLKLI
jgi:hypothetical protein